MILTVGSSGLIEISVAPSGFIINRGGGQLSGIIGSGLVFNSNIYYEPSGGFVKLSSTTDDASILPYNNPFSNGSSSGLMYRIQGSGLLNNNNFIKFFQESPEGVSTIKNSSTTHTYTSPSKTGSSPGGSSGGGSSGGGSSGGGGNYPPDPNYEETLQKVEQNYRELLAQRNNMELN
jgi:uncharacterized membrane protein YgcG